jgi:hypothetical protein
MVREAGKIMCRRINETTAFTKPFSRDKNPELVKSGVCFM